MLNHKYHKYKESYLESVHDGGLVFVREEVDSLMQHLQSFGWGHSCGRKTKIYMKNIGKIQKTYMLEADRMSQLTNIQQQKKLQNVEKIWQFNVDNGLNIHHCIWYAQYIPRYISGFRGCTIIVYMHTAYAQYRTRYLNCIWLFLRYKNDIDMVHII